MAKSVLIVDDNSAIRKTLCQAFTSKQFYVCSEAEDGRDAIEKARASKPDLIVMDLSMPIMNGLEAAGVLRKSLPNVPIILFSDYSALLSAYDERSAFFAATVPKSEPLAVLVRTARQLCYPPAA